MPKARDLTGWKFGRLTAVARQGWIVRSGTRFRLWLCVCECGTEVVAATGSLTSGNTQSCGCRKAGMARARLTSHGASKTVIYRLWRSMIARCGNPKKACYKDYGRRGITVCTRWLESFEQFRSDMGERPPGGSIERKDNDGNYEPGNCVWLSRSLQNRNQRQRQDNSTGVTGVVRHKRTGRWEAFIGHEGKRLYLGLFTSLEDAAAARAAAMTKLGFNPNHGAHK